MRHTHTSSKTELMEWSHTKLPPFGDNLEQVTLADKEYLIMFLGKSMWSHIQYSMLCDGHHDVQSFMSCSHIKSDLSGKLLRGHVSGTKGN